MCSVIIILFPQRTSKVFYLKLQLREKNSSVSWFYNLDCSKNPTCLFGEVAPRQTNSSRKSILVFTYGKCCSLDTRRNIMEAAYPVVTMS